MLHQAELLHLCLDQRNGFPMDGQVFLPRTGKSCQLSNRTWQIRPVQALLRSPSLLEEQPGSVCFTLSRADPQIPLNSPFSSLDFYRISMVQCFHKVHTVSLGVVLWGGQHDPLESTIQSAKTMAT
jgi:hypothetical protein